MISAEDQLVLGLPKRASPSRRSTAVSQLLRAVRDSANRAAEGAETTTLPMLEESPDDWRVCVANSQALREEAYCLAYRVYLSRGYLEPQEPGWLTDPFDATPETFTLLAQDPQGHAAGTVTLNFDSPGGLHCDELYGAETGALRRQGRRLAEVTRFAIDPQFSNSKTLLIQLFNLIFLFAKHARNCTDFVIEVTPQHGHFYRRLLGFESLGPVKANPRVNGTFGLLLRLKFAFVEEEVRRWANADLEAAARCRNLYRYYIHPTKEARVTALLDGQHRPMSAAEAVYFGLLAPAGQIMAHRTE